MTAENVPEITARTGEPHVCVYVSAALNATDYNTLVWTDPLNAVSIRIYRTAGGLTQGLIGTVAAGVGTFRDDGDVGDGTTAPSANTTGVGIALPVSDLRDLTLQVSGTFVATMQLQGKIDGQAAWQNVGSAISSAGFTDVYTTAKTLSQLRMTMSAYTSGTPVAVVAGH